MIIVDLAWLSLVIAAAFMFRSVRIRLGRSSVASLRFGGHFATAERLLPFTRSSNGAIALWREQVDQEDIAFESRTPFESADVLDRAASPSTVAGWSTITGVVSLGQSVAPPPRYEDI
jgi:hypothetical protein